MCWTNESFCDVMSAYFMLQRITYVDNVLTIRNILRRITYRFFFLCFVMNKRNFFVWIKIPLAHYLIQRSEQQVRILLFFSSFLHYYIKILFSTLLTRNNLSSFIRPVFVNLFNSKFSCIYIDRRRTYALSNQCVNEKEM